MIACDTDLYHNFSISTRMTLAWSDLRGGGGAETCIHHFKRTSSTQAIKCSADLQMCGSFDGTVLFTATMERVDALLLRGSPSNGARVKRGRDELQVVRD